MKIFNELIVWRNKTKQRKLERNHLIITDKFCITLHERTVKVINDVCSIELTRDEYKSNDDKSCLATVPGYHLPGGALMVGSGCLVHGFFGLACLMDGFLFL